MVKSRRMFTREFKLAAVKELESGKPLGYVARRVEVNPNTLHRWRSEFKEQPTKAFSGQGRRLLAESREAELERKIGQLTMENDFLKKLLRSFEEQRSALAADGLRKDRHRRENNNQPVPRREPSRILLVSQTGPGECGGDGVARCDSTCLRVLLVAYGCVTLRWPLGPRI